MPLRPPSSTSPTVALLAGISTAGIKYIAVVETDVDVATTPRERRSAPPRTTTTLFNVNRFILDDNLAVAGRR